MALLNVTLKNHPVLKNSEGFFCFSFGRQSKNNNPKYMGKFNLVDPRF